MRAVIAFVLGSLVACSASEDANQSIRCDLEKPCPGELVCYRSFCIPNDVPRYDLDAGGFTGETPTLGQDASQLADAASSDALDGGIADPLVPNTEDAQTAAPVPDPVDADAATDVPGQVPTEPLTDGGPPATDPGSPGTDAGSGGSANSAALLVCLPSCSNQNVRCLLCLQKVLKENPGVCSQADPQNEPLVSNLCQWLCTSAACQGGP